MTLKTQDEIIRKLNKMEPPMPKLKDYGSFTLQINSNQVEILLIDAFNSGYKQAIKEMKKYFNIKELENKQKELKSWQVIVFIYTQKN